MKRLSILIYVYQILTHESIEEKGLLHNDTIKLSQRLDLLIVEKQIHMAMS